MIFFPRKEIIIDAAGLMVTQKKGAIVNCDIQLNLMKSKKLPLANYMVLLFCGRQHDSIMHT